MKKYLHWIAIAGLPHTTRTYVWGRSLLLKPIRMREQSRFVGYRQVK